MAAWRRFAAGPVGEYAAERDRPDRPGTSRMSVYLKYGCVHPRTLFADLAPRPGRSIEAYRGELAWREFHADVLWHRPDSARRNYNRRFDGLPHEDGADAPQRFAAWAHGRTGYPIVGAGMRQLRAEAWVHNRVRMIVASFLVKDLHLPWWWGTRHFMRHLLRAAASTLNGRPDRPEPLRRLPTGAACVVARRSSSSHRPAGARGHNACAGRALPRMVRAGRDRPTPDALLSLIRLTWRGSEW